MVLLGKVIKVKKNEASAKILFLLSVYFDPNKHKRGSFPELQRFSSFLAVSKDRAQSWREVPPSSVRSSTVSGSVAARSRFRHIFFLLRQSGWIVNRFSFGKTSRSSPLNFVVWKAFPKVSNSSRFLKFRSNLAMSCSGENPASNLTTAEKFAASCSASNKTIVSWSEVTESDRAWKKLELEKKTRFGIVMIHFRGFLQTTFGNRMFLLLVLFVL